MAIRAVESYGSADNLHYPDFEDGSYSYAVNVDGGHVTLRADDPYNSIHIPRGIWEAFKADIDALCTLIPATTTGESNEQD